MRRSGTRITLGGIVWALLLGGGILAHRSGWLPSWVYQGKLRDEVKRRTGVDLADRSTPKPIVEVTNVRGAGGRYPTLTVEVRNAADTALRRLDMWATFHLATSDAGYTQTVRVANYDKVLKPGETRTVRFTGPVCKKNVQMVADRDDLLNETNEDDNSLRARCPVIGA